MLSLSRTALTRLTLSGPAGKIHPILLRHEPRSSVHLIWPEPVTLPTITDFLDQINYYEEPRNIINIGIKQKDIDANFKKEPTITKNKQLKDQDQIGKIDLEKVLELLSQETENEPLDFDAINSAWNISLDGRNQLARLAVHFGIYRDLFSDYESPKKGPINFTKELAEKLDKFVPYYWITDLPFSRVPIHKTEEPKMYYFDPVVPILAEFISSSGNKNNLNQDQQILSHISYHGNYIPAYDAKQKPSISLDGRILSSLSDNGESELTQEVKDQINCNQSSWSEGKVQMNNFSPSYRSYLSLILLNLDNVHYQSGMIHWMISNIHQDPSDHKVTRYDEVCEYLPVYGVNGFGHSRYVFVLFEHTDKLYTASMRISTFSPELRRFNGMDFVTKNKGINLRPVGLSWFQAAWDHSAKSVFQDYLNMREPFYEHVLTKRKVPEEKAYPSRVPFNIYLDSFMDPKEMNKRVLLERLEKVDPFDYKDQYEPPKIPEDVHSYVGKKRIPSWMRIPQWKKNNKLGYWRGLRPASALLPLNNNVDLDAPCRPLAPESKQPYLRPNPYPGRRKYKPKKDLPYLNIPVNEQPSVYIVEGHEASLNESDRKKAGI